jgi:hypothetical protein
MKLLFSILLLGISALTAVAQWPGIKPGVSPDLAAWRAAHYSDVRYKLNLTLEKMSPVLKGRIEITMNLSEPPASAGGQLANQTTLPIILDWSKIAGHEKDSVIMNLSLNGHVSMLRPPEGFKWSNGEYVYDEVEEHLIFRQGVIPGENVIKFDFSSPILTSGSAITRYIDKEDGSEYIYSILSPSNASTAFPMFNQPDLKARFQLGLIVPEGWNAVSNTDPGLVKGGAFVRSFGFPDTIPTSPYAFAFAAGPWKEQFGEWNNKDVMYVGAAGGNPSGSAGESVPLAVGGGAVSSTPKTSPSATADGTDKSEPLVTHIYVRKSQAAKFQPRTAEIFKQTRESNKYFDHKTAWPKYDLVLIPDLPSEMVQAAGITFVRESSIIGDR